MATGAAGPPRQEAGELAETSGSPGFAPCPEPRSGQGVQRVSTQNPAARTLGWKPARAPRPPSHLVSRQPPGPAPHPSRSSGPRSRRGRSRCRPGAGPHRSPRSGRGWRRTGPHLRASRCYQADGGLAADGVGQSPTHHCRKPRTASEGARGSRVRWAPRQAFTSLWGRRRAAGASDQPSQWALEATPLLWRQAGSSREASFFSNTCPSHC